MLLITILQETMTSKSRLDLLQVSLTPYPKRDVGVLLLLLEKQLEIL